jgi:hypothetical protein
MASDAKTQLTGGCQCGAVRYALSAGPSGASICHCRMCQKAGGAPFMAFAGVPLADLKFTRGSPRIFASSDLAERGFCAACGTPLTYRIHGRDRISFTIGSLDKPGAVAPTEQVGVEAELPWFPSLASLPRLKTSDWLTQEKFGPVGNKQHADHD